jgi:hypothetical protein
MEVELTTTTLLAAPALPKVTAVAPVRAVPVMVTDVFPAIGPLVGLTAVTVGTGTYVNWSTELVGLIPPGFVTVTSTAPLPAGLVAVICVSELIVKLEAGVAPKLTPVAVLKVVPVIVTVVPPTAGPEVGLMLETVGAPAGT